MTKISIQDIRQRHEILIAKSDTPKDILTEVETLLQDILNAGGSVPIGNQRDLLQSLATFWANYIFDNSETGVYPSTELYPFTGRPAITKLIQVKESASGRRNLLIALAAILIVSFTIILRANQSNGSARATETSVAKTLTAAAVVITPTYQSATQTPSPTLTITPTLSPVLLTETPPSIAGIDVQIVNLVDGEEIRPEDNIIGVYSNLDAGWSIHAILQPLSQGGRLYPVEAFYEVPAGIPSGEWIIDPNIEERPELNTGEHYNIYQVIALDDIGRRALTRLYSSGFESFDDLPATILSLPSVTTVKLNPHEKIAEVRLIYSSFVEDDDNLEIVASLPDGTDPIRLTYTLSMNELQPSLSPTGNQIVFRGSELDESDEMINSIWIMDSDGQHRQMLISNPETLYERPVYSPNGRYIAYGANVPNEDGKIWKVFIYDTETKEHILLSKEYDSLRYPSWMPDSIRLVVGGFSVESFTQGLFELNIETQAVTYLFDTDKADMQPSVSPDGKLITYLSFNENETDSNRDIYLLDLASYESLQLTTNPALDWWPAWHPTDETIYFQTYRSEGLVGIWAINSDGSNVRPIIQSIGANTGPFLGLFKAYIEETN